MSKKIEPAVRYDEIHNSLQVNGYQLTEEYVGEWKISVRVFAFSKFVEDKSYKNFFMLNILPAA